MKNSLTSGIFIASAVQLLIAPFYAFKEGRVSESLPARQPYECKAGCSRIDSKKSSIYLYKDANWIDPNHTRMILKNNSTCKIIVTTIGKQTIVGRDGRLLQLPAAVAEDRANLVLQYKVNSRKQPWAFVTHWPYGHLVNTTEILPGREVMFLIESRQIRDNLGIAVPFDYDWDPLSPGMDHLVYATKYDLL